MKTAVTYRAHCLVCEWATQPATAAADVAAVDLEARKHTGEGAYAKKSGPHHATTTMGLPT